MTECADGRGGKCEAAFGGGGERMCVTEFAGGSGREHEAVWRWTWT